MFIHDNTIEIAVDIALTTRDFCGDEAAAIRDFGRDNGIKNRDDLDRLVRIAIFRANNVWRKHQRAAGVPEKHIMG